MPQRRYQERTMYCGTCMVGVPVHFGNKRVENGKEIFDVFCNIAHHLVTRFVKNAEGEWELDISFYRKEVA